MRIQIDARLLNSGGIGRYIREIVGPWLVDRRVERVRCFGHPEELRAWLADRDPRGIVDVVPWVDPVYSLRAQVNWPRLHQGPHSWPADVSLFPHYDIPLLAHPAPSVVVVHDLIHLEVADAFPAWKRAGAAAMLRAVCQRATEVITVSRASGRAIRAFMGDSGPRVHVVPNGVSEVFVPPPEPLSSAVPAPVAPYVLVVAPHKPHKNLAFAVRVLGHLPEREGWRLLLVGPRGAEVAAIARAAGQPGLEARIEAVGAVDDRALRDLYRGARAVLVPSRLEGFGLPALEACACGTRALAPDLPWARELAMFGVERLRHWEPGAWARAIRARPAGALPASSPRADVPRWREASDATFDLLRAVTHS